MQCCADLTARSIELDEKGIAVVLLVLQGSINDCSVNEFAGYVQIYAKEKLEKIKQEKLDIPTQPDKP
jgi:hypothetical protein